VLHLDNYAVSWLFVISITQKPEIVCSQDGRKINFSETVNQNTCILRKDVASVQMY
jgi:hypothetical protein